MNKMTVPLLRHSHGEGLPLPFYATPGSVGLDLAAAIVDPITLLPTQYVLVPTGFSIALPEGFEGQIRGRSGLALKHGLAVLNSPGTIDWDYRSELKVILINQGTEPFLIERGLRIAQLVIAPVQHITLKEMTAFPEDVTADRGSGFGSTGLK